MSKLRLLLNENNFNLQFVSFKIKRVAEFDSYTSAIGSNLCYVELAPKSV